MIRRIIEFSIDKPLLNHIFLLFILLLSIFAYINIPKEIFPPIQMDKISINGGYVGTSANVLDKMVVSTIEDDLQNINELDTVKTNIRNGSFSILADIKPGSDNIQVLQDVKDIIAQTKRDLPADMNEPIAKIHVETIPLVLIAIAGEVPTRELLARAEELKSSLSQFKDLSEISIRGDSDEELVLRLNEAKIRAFGLEINSVVAAMQNLSSIFPIGTIKERGEHLYISTYNGEKDQASLEDSIINVGGEHVRLGDVADISFELGDENEISHYNGVRNISVNITKSKSGNAIALAKEIRLVLAEYKTRYPHLAFDVYTDTSVWIKNRLNTVFANIMFGLILVFLAMLIFVNRGIALVVAMGIPLSFMIGLIVSESAGYSLNMLSLLGALIALGMLVDEAIVVAENIYRHLEEGMEPREAAIVGTMEMFPAVLTATLTTIFAFLPMLLISGEMGAFIKILPIMISVLLISSLFEAFYFLPLHSYELLRLRKEGHMTHGIWETMYGFYDRVLRRLLKKKILSLALIVTTILLATAYMINTSRFQLFPEFDVTQVYVSGKVNINNDLENTEKLVTTLEKVLLERLKDDDYISVTSVIGLRIDAKNKAEIGENLFHIFIELHERAPDNVFNKYINPYFSLEYDPDLLIRERSAYAIKDEIVTLMKPYTEAKVDGELVYEELNTDVQGTGVVAHDVEIAISGKSDDELVLAVKRLEKKMHEIEALHNIADDADIGEKELKLRVNSYGQQLGFNEQLITQELRAYYLKGEYGKMFNENGLVRVRIEGNNKDSLASLNDLQVQVPGTTNYIALQDVCDFILTQGFVNTIKEDGKRIRSVFASIHKEKMTSSEAMAALRPTVDSLADDGFIVEVKGEEKENTKTQREMGQAAVMAIFLIFITLVWLFDSLKNSLIVLSTIPLVLLGVYVGHMIMGLNIGMTSLIGIVGLAGVVVNDGLIMVSFIKRAKDLDEVVRLAKTRLRPILLTSITTVLGLSTLIFFASGQAQILQPMAVALGFGITWATVLNLIYVPILYAVIYRIKSPAS
ncbi:MAG: efflux RND transporter permease subunit [Helicobacteraceae bacterium]|jgi:HAE1 family hydrophobic/amphiphilic exporter-1|nr:efflux RND transporter permease subunit [Helicobacteraceae bacterium]